MIIVGLFPWEPLSSISQTSWLMVTRFFAGNCLIRSEMFNWYTSHGSRCELEAQATLITTVLQAALSILRDVLYDVTVFQV